MKKIATITSLLILFAIVVSNLCQQDEAGVNLYAQNLPGVVKIDTVNSIFSVTFAPSYPGCITAIGADLIFDNATFEYLPDSTQLYGVFPHEVINFFTPNRIAFGFNSTADVCGFSKAKPLFTIAFKVKESVNEPILKYFELQNISIQRSGKEIKYKSATARLAIIAMQLFMLNWIIKTY